MELGEGARLEISIYGEPFSLFWGALDMDFDQRGMTPVSLSKVGRVDKMVATPNERLLSEAKGASRKYSHFPVDLVQATITDIMIR